MTVVTDVTVNVAAASGGLHVIGVGRHALRRVDDQLRNRAGMHGTPGSSRFFLSPGDSIVAALDETPGLDAAGFAEGERITRMVAYAQRKPGRDCLRTCPACAIYRSQSGCAESTSLYGPDPVWLRPDCARIVM